MQHMLLRGDRRREGLQPTDQHMRLQRQFRYPASGVLADLVKLIQEIY